MIAGSLPLFPYFAQFLGFPLETRHQLFVSIISTALALFLVGALRTIVTGGKWWRNGFEVLGVGAVAATVAYALGAFIDQIT